MFIHCTEEDPEGWIKNGDLEVDWMNGPAAPEAVHAFIPCKRTRSCTLPKCTCLANGLKCTDLCKLDCDNREQNDVMESDVDIGGD